MMSQENVELVRSAVEAYNAGPEAYLAFMAEDIEVRPDASVFPEGTLFAAATSSGAFSPRSTRAGRAETS